jgi:hypothetical protein
MSEFVGTVFSSSPLINKPEVRMRMELPIHCEDEALINPVTAMTSLYLPLTTTLF